jgi:SAM-dependent methyltransferase
MRIMDVGCGRGQLLSILHRAGLPYLFGVDPYLPTDVEVVPGVRVLKRHVHEVEDNFDLIMLHHVFEHIEDGLDMLVACRRRLTAGGKILLRMPIVDCWAWERYREYWVALDAPRHLVLHTRASLERLAGQAGLRVAQCCCDSTAFQFFASELYRKGLPLVDGQGQTTRTENHFTPDQMKQFEREAQSLNAANRGDQIVAILQPLDD